MRWLKHAFAVDPPGPAEPSPAQREVLDRVCRQIARRRLTTPGLIALEVSRPLNFVASQALHMLTPAVWAIAREQTLDQYKEFTAFLEQRGSMEYFCRRIEHFEQEYERLERERRAAGSRKETEDGGAGPGA